MVIPRVLDRPLFSVIDNGLTLSANNTNTFVGATVNIEIDAPAADYLRIITSKPNKSISETKLIYDTSASLDLTTDNEGIYTVKVEAIKDNEVYAQDSLTIDTIYALSLSQYYWQVLNTDENLSVQVEAGADWSIGNVSTWLNAVKDGDCVILTVNTDTVDGKTGYVEIICGNARAAIDVVGGEGGSEINITNPDNSLVSNSEDLKVSWDAVENASEYMLMLYNATENSYPVIVNDAMQTEGYVIPAELLMNGNEYTLTIIASVYSTEDDRYREIRTERQFAIEASENATVNGYVMDSDRNPIARASVRVFADDKYLTSAYTDSQGKWYVNGLNVNGSYRFIAYYGEYTTDEIETVLTQNNNELADLVFTITESSEENTIDIDEDSVYCLEIDGIVETLTTSEAWLKYEMQIEENKTILNLWVDTAEEESSSSELTVMFEDGGEEVYQVCRSIIEKTYTEYLAETNVSVVGNYEFISQGMLFNKTYHSNGDGEITGTLKNSAKTIIEAGDTLRVSGEGTMIIDGDLEIRGNLILESSSMVRLDVKGNVIVTGQLTVDDCSVNIGKSLKLKGSMRVSSSSKNITASNTSGFKRKVMVGNELLLESAACLTLDSGAIDVDGSMKVLNYSQLRMEGGFDGSAISVSKKLTFNSTTDSILSKGEIFVFDDVSLLDGYVATSKNHTLRLGAHRVFIKAKLEFAKDKNQKIGRLYLHDSDMYKGWRELDESDYYSIYMMPSAVKEVSEPSENPGDFSIDLEKLQLAMTYRDCSLYSVTPWLGIGEGKKLSDAEEAAVVMRYMEEIGNCSDKNVPLTSLVLPNIAGKTYGASYFDENGREQTITFTVKGMISASGKVSGNALGATGILRYSIGSAWISIGNSYYFIAPSSSEALQKMLQGMTALLMVDAAKNIKDALTIKIDPAAAFGKNGWITYLKYVFNKVGVNTDGISTIENLKKGLEAETAEEYREAIKNLIDIAAKNV